VNLLRRTWVGLVLLALLAGALWARGPAPLATITADRLPVEAQATLMLIRAGGPFPYTQDGTVFGNRERLLPFQPRGYYREYTVPTPGRRGRGARRIVAGKPSEYYWTVDHYRSFVRITGAP
jgi:ribonuclease T1